MNKVYLHGRLVKDPERKNTQSGKSVCSFTVATDKPLGDGKHGADFIPCVAWNKTAEFVSKFFSKGQEICLEGHLNQSTWVDKDLNNRSRFEVYVGTVEFCGSKKDSTTRAVDLEELTDDDGDLPF